MSAQWVVVLRRGVDPDEIVVYGPFDHDTAGHFAAYLAAEVDPAGVHEVRSPVRELLGWREHVLSEQRPRTDLENLLRRLVEHETDPCELDHHGYCQAHHLHSPPCPVAVGRKLLGLDEKGPS